MGNNKFIPIGQLPQEIQDEIRGRMFGDTVENVQGYDDEAEKEGRQRIVMTSISHMDQAYICYGKRFED